MATFVHARRREGQLLFRVWNTVVDRYETEPLTRDQARLYLMGELQIDSAAKREADAALGMVFGTLSRMPGIARVTPSGDASAHTRVQADERLERASINGTSSRMGDKDDIDGDWDTERCDECGGFHHTFEASSDGTCSECGEPGDYRDHHEPCVT